MASPVLVPCLVILRSEFNSVSPKRDKGADGWIGDSAHKNKESDHNPDETGRTPFEDTDKVDEVHALDIDSTGPWPTPSWFNSTVLRIVSRHRNGLDDRLQNVIWNGKIASRSRGWEWTDYHGTNKHTDHAHFSARYTTKQESDTSPWGVKTILEEAFMSLKNDNIIITEDTADEIGKKAGDVVSAATLLQLGVIHAHRAAVNATVARKNTELILNILKTPTAH
jgi:hypothetical protein